MSRARVPKGPVLVPLLSAVLLSAVALAVGQKARPSGALNLGPLLGKPVAEYEKVLGKPSEMTDADFKPTKDPNAAKRYYRRAGFKKIQLYSATPDHVSYVEVQFPVGLVKGWKAALARIGLPSAGVVATKKGKSVSLSGGAGWGEGYWVTKDPDRKCDWLSFGVTKP